MALLVDPQNTDGKTFFCLRQLYIWSADLADAPMSSVLIHLPLHEHLSGLDIAIIQRSKSLNPTRTLHRPPSSIALLARVVNTQVILHVALR